MILIDQGLSVDLFEASYTLGEMLEKTKTVYLRTTPEIPDFTNHTPVKVTVIGGNKRVDLEVDANGIGFK